MNLATALGIRILLIESCIWGFFSSVNALLLLNKVLGSVLRY